jgi:hypothetical protein
MVAATSLACFLSASPIALVMALSLASNALERLEVGQGNYNIEQTDSLRGNKAMRTSNMFSIEENKRTYPFFHRQLSRIQGTRCQGTKTSALEDEGKTAESKDKSSIFRSLGKKYTYIARRKCGLMCLQRARCRLCILLVALALRISCSFLQYCYY